MADFERTFPIIPHEPAGVDRCGCIVVIVTEKIGNCDARSAALSWASFGLGS